MKIPIYFVREHVNDSESRRLSWIARAVVWG